MRKRKQRRLEAKGWKVGKVREFLGLSNEEAAYIELKIKLAEGLRQRRQQKGLSQLDLAARLESSQSRVAKMEAGDPSVSLDLLIRCEGWRPEIFASAKQNKCSADNSYISNQ